MKTLIILLIVYIGTGVLAWAKTAKTNSTPRPAAAGQTPQLTTDAKFDGHVVGGKIQAPFESLAVVENEKSIDDLIGVRKDFHDRSEKAKGLR